MTSSTPFLFSLLRSAILGAPLTDNERHQYTAESQEEMFKLAHKHDVVPLLVEGLKKNGILTDSNTQLEQYLFFAVMRYEQLNYEYQRTCAALEAAQIPFMPLKGAVMRRYYPAAWMRTSCDVDILVPEEKLEEAVWVLVDQCGYVSGPKGPHDISLRSPSKVHIELHYSLMEDGRINNATPVLETVWDTAVLRDGCAFWHEMPDEMFYFYHIAHMAKHFQNGGCGIRTLIDLWILDHLPNTNLTQRHALLKKGDLFTFAQNVSALCNIWFGEEEHNVFSKKLENYILRGGIYGSNENQVIFELQTKGSKRKYITSRIFIPYDVIKFQYPILKKHRWLTPVMEVCRWCRLLFGGHMGRVRQELAYTDNIHNSEGFETQAFLKNIGL